MLNERAVWPDVYVTYISGAKRARKVEATMTILQRRTLGWMAAVMVVGFPAAALADRQLDPDTLSPKDREFALHGPIGQYDPYGNPATPNCQWSRIQVPTGQGLKWVLQEECQLNFTR